MCRTRAAGVVLHGGGSGFDPGQTFFDHFSTFFADAVQTPQLLWTERYHIRELVVFESLQQQCDSIR